MRAAVGQFAGRDLVGEGGGVSPPSVRLATARWPCLLLSLHNYNVVEEDVAAVLNLFSASC